MWSPTENAQSSAPNTAEPVPDVASSIIPHEYNTTDTPDAVLSEAQPPFIPATQSREIPSFIDGFTGIILCSAGMAGFLGLVYGVRLYTKDLPLDLGSAILVVLIVIIVLGIAGFQYLLRKRRAAP